MPSERLGSEVATKTQVGRESLSKLFSWRKARRALHSNALSETNIHLRAIPGEDSRNDFDRDLVDLVMRICELALSTGASVSDTTGMALRIFDTHKLTAHVDVTSQSIIVSRPGGPNVDPITAMRHVQHQAIDYARLANLEQLVNDLAANKLVLTEARRRFNDLAVEPRLYRVWVCAAGAGLMGAAVALTLGAEFIETLVGGLSVMLIFWLQRKLSKARVSVFFSQAIGGAIPAVIAMSLLMILPSSVNWSPSLVVAAGIVFMLAGLNMVNAAQEALDGYYVSSAAKVLEVFMLTGGIIAGVMAALWIGVKVGAPPAIWPTGGYSVDPALMVVCGGLMSAFFAVTCYATPKMFSLSFLFGAVAQACALLAGLVFDYIPLERGVGAFAAGLLAAFAASKFKVPIIALISTSVLPLMPGSLIYRGLYGVILHQSNTTLGLESADILLQALLTGTLLAVGSSLGRLIARPFSMPKSKTQRRSLIKSWRHGTR